MLITIFLLANGKDDTITRRGFFAKLRDAYREGRAATNEQRILQRKEQEKLRRRAVFERNVRSLVDGISKRLRHSPRRLGIMIIGGTILIVYLCDKGSVGCDKNKTP